MKAESFVYTGAQKPVTVFGVPPLLLMLCGAAFGVVFAVFVVLKLALPGFLTALAVFVMMALFFYRRTRQDHHFVSTLIVPVRFWRRRKVRHLIAGHPPVLASAKRRL